MECYIIEAQLIEHPDYETFVDVVESEEKAIEYVRPKLQEEIDDLGEGEIITKRIDNGQIRMEVEGGQVFFITRHAIK